MRGLGWIMMSLLALVVLVAVWWLPARDGGARPLPTREPRPIAPPAPKLPRWEVVIKAPRPHPAAALEHAMQILAPELNLTKRRDLQTLAAAIAYTARDWEIDPMIALAVAYRESSFDARIGRGEKRGSRGEIGWFQVMPHSAAVRACGGCSLTNTMCNASTAMCWLALRREECGDDPWVWVAAYGRRGRCARPWEARRFYEVREARRHYCRIADEEGWPL